MTTGAKWSDAELMTDAVGDALRCARLYMIAREPAPMPDWVKLVENAIAVHRERHPALVAALRGLIDAVERDAGDSGVAGHTVVALAAGRAALLRAAVLGRILT